MQCLSRSTPKEVYMQNLSQINSGIWSLGSAIYLTPARFQLRAILYSYVSVFMTQPAHAGISQYSQYGSNEGLPV